MLSRGKKMYWVGMAAAAVLLLLATVLFYPGFSGTNPPPETIGGDVVVSGQDFAAGQFAGTGLMSAGGLSASQALTLDSLRPGQRGDYTSEPIRAEYPFNALGLHWLAQEPPGTSVEAEVRFSSDGTEWGDWQRVAADSDDVPDHINNTRSAGETIGQLLFAEEARFFQYRLYLAGNEAGESPSISRLTASYIDSMGYHESPVSLDKVWAGVKAIVMPKPARAQPRIISRAEWGADERLMTWTPEYEPVKKQIIHHTAGDQGPDPAATVRGIYYYHAVSNGWGDIGYNFLIDRSGNIYEGRYGGNGAVGGHALAWNYGSIGIAALGNYENYDITPQMYTAFVELMAWKSNVNRIDPLGNDPMLGTNKPNYLGHRDVGSTACPGDYLYRRIPAIRNDARDRYSPIPIETPFLEKWEALHGAPGAATNGAYDITGGKAQNFQFGRLIWNRSAGNTFWVLGGIMARYDALGKWNGILGLPTSDEYGVGAGRASNFTGGRLYWSGATGTYYVMGGILQKYLAEGGPNRIGFPVSDEHAVSGVSGARQSHFQYGRIYWDAAHSAHMIYGAIMAKYLEKGGPAVLGIPISDEHNVSGRAGVRQSDFTRGVIYWSSANGAYPVSGDFRTEHDEWGGAGGYPGLPTGDQRPVATGQAQDFERVVITKGSSGGTHVTYGAVLAKYRQLGGPAGALGVATTDEIAAPGVSGARESDFKNGRIYWSPATGATGIYGAILARYIEKGASAAFGIPVKDERDIAGVPGGRQSDLQTGSIYWSAGTGAWEVYGAIASKWYELGGPAKGLGMPVTGEMATTGGRESRFQRGRIYWSGSTGAHAVYGAILSKYSEIGGPAGSLGLPVSDEYSHANGRRSDFQGGYIYWSAQTGTQVFVGTGTPTTVTSSASFEVRDGNGGLLASLSAGQVASVSYAGGVYTLRAPGVSRTGTSYIRMNPTGGGIMQVTSYHDIPAWNPNLDDNKFRGSIEVRYSPVSGGLWVVNEIPLEHYLRGIAETSAGVPAEYLKTMTVAARSYALWHRNRGGKYGSSEIFHLKNSRNGNGDDQQYKGYGLEVRFPTLVSAVTGTARQVVTYGGNLAITPYFSNSDGRTRSAQEAWGITYWPWLQSVSDPDCSGMALNGHGVGLSGKGALERAGRGNSYTTILGYYYKGTAVQAVGTNPNIRIAIQRVS